MTVARNHFSNSFGDQPQQPGEPAPKAGVLDEYAWHTGNAAGNDPAVGALKPNPWGLYDMHGYLSEFCLDDWQPDYQQVPEASHQPVRNGSKECVIRGGSWQDPFPELRSSARRPFLKTAVSPGVGFRCVIAPEK